jgi:glucosamine--fructose-6-phosphate aminotransferase (isomerizing)
LQLLSYYIANFKGCSIDQPRNLAKSVTVEWPLIVFSGNIKN